MRKEWYKAAAVLWGVMALGWGVGSPALGAQEFVYSVNAEVPGLDPQKSNSVPSMVIGIHVWEGLVRVHDGKILPGMAEKWEISVDGLVYTFHLRDAQWSDGSPVTAQDFVYTFQRLLDPKVAAEYAFAAYGIVNGAKYNKGEIADPSEVGVKALDDKTLQIVLETPMNYFLGYLQLMCFLPCKKDFVEAAGDAFATDADKMLYNGPFVLKEWKHEEMMVLEKNPNYWNKDAIKLDRVTVHQVYEANTALSMFENGELDMVNIPSNLYAQYQKEGRALVYMTGADDWIKVNVHPNPEKPWLSNKNFRKALAFAIDREQYLQIATKGLYFPNPRYVLPIMAGLNGKYGDEFPLEFYSKNAEPDKAKEYLQKALEELGIDDPAKITVTYTIQDEEECRLMAEALQDQLQRALGITVKVQLVTRKQRATLENQREYDLVYSGWAPDYDDPLTYIEIWTGDNPHNNSGFAHDKFDNLVAISRTEVNPQKRLDVLFEAEKILLDEAPMIPLQLRRRAWTAQPYVQGVVRPFIGADLDFVFASVEGK